MSFLKFETIEAVLLSCSYKTDQAFRILKSNRPYIKDHQKDLVKKHKYQGEELSYAYNYFWSPLCAWIAQRLPMWLAPNMISLIGFSFNIGPHILIGLLFTNEHTYALPSWFCYLLGVSFFTYCVCDNTDGKQARRTGSSSPLGMLIDHGMDSITAVINTMIIQVMLQVGNNFLCVFSMIAATQPFYFAVLEQYYTGDLVLPEINGIDEGSFVYVILCFLCGYYGPGVFNGAKLTLFGFQIQLNYLIIYALIGSSFLQIIPKKDLFIGHILWYWINAILFFVAAYTSPQNIAVTHGKRVCYAFGFNFILIAIRVQFCGVTLEKFNPFRRTILISWAVLISQIISTLALNKSLMHEPTMYLILDIMSFSSLLHMVYCLISELTQILDINVLTLTQKQLDAQTKKGN